MAVLGETLRSINSITVMLVAAVSPLYSAVIVVEPADKAVTNPLLDTSVMAEFEEDQVTNDVRFLVVPFE